MRVQDQPAYVLHARPWRETSLIVELLTREHGRVGLVARGVQGPKRHPLRAALQPLQHVRVDYLQRGELGRLLQAEALDVAPVLRGDPLLAAFYVAELLLRLLRRWRGRCGGSNAICSNCWATGCRSTVPTTARRSTRRRVTCSTANAARCATTATRAARSAARRCWRWRKTACRHRRSWPNCAARCAACCRDISAARRSSRGG